MTTPTSSVLIPSYRRPHALASCLRSLAAQHSRPTEVIVVWQADDTPTREAAEGLRDVQAQLADVGPRLRAAEGMFQRTLVRSPADGYVFGLTQHTVGGVVTPGERLLDVVPSNAPVVVEARIRPPRRPASIRT